MFKALKRSIRDRRNHDKNAGTDNINQLSSVGTSASSNIDATLVQGPADDLTLSQEQALKASPQGLSPSPTSRSSSRRQSSPRVQQRKNEPLGLHVVYDPPEGQHAIDIIFVHGLGGTSRLTWSWNRDLAFFWPKEWLPLEPQIKEARILTFGYNAHFLSQSNDVFNISDFAKDLLMQMKFGNDKELQSWDLGKVPIVFVVHSMGGLIVKKAYILGCHDPEYKEILGTICSLVFLGTPHRGSNLAEILNKLLLVSLQSPRQYINELRKGSTSIQDANEQFRHYANRFQMVSFFETQPTSVGPRKLMIVERDSAVLDYPGEISAPLIADHHTLCKFPSQQDPNYVSVRNVIMSLVEKFKFKQTVASHRSVNLSSVVDKISLSSVLGIQDRPNEILESHLEHYVTGSCDWFTSSREFKSWVYSTVQGVSVFHVMGRPGAGKSVLASFVVRHLEQLNLPAQFWFFWYNDQRKRLIKNCLLSLVFQTAMSFPEFRRRLLLMKEDIEAIVQSDVKVIWQKLVVDNFARLEKNQPLYWIIDALDESESLQSFLGLLPSLRRSPVSVRVIVFTRPQVAVKQFDRLRKSLPTVSHAVLNTPDSSASLYIEQEFQFAAWPEKFKEEMTRKLLQKSQSNFLWLRLVVKELLLCDTMDAVDMALQDIPTELMDLYTRLENALVGSYRGNDMNLSRIIFTWIICSNKQLNLSELREALHPEFDILDMRQTIIRLCGDFVILDNKEQVSLVHHTCAEFLTSSKDLKLSVELASAHAYLFEKCLALLTDRRLRLTLKSHGCSGLLRYASLSWSIHLIGSEALDTSTVHKVARFLSSSSVLSWIHAIALTGQLLGLVTTAKSLTKFINKRHKVDADLVPVNQPLADIDLIAQWSTELVRLVGKFGHHLTRHPTSIYTLIPAFCPSDSIISRQFLSNSLEFLRVTGISDASWDDSIAKFSVGYDCAPTKVWSLDNQFAVLASRRDIFLYSSGTFQEIRRFRSEEIIVASCFNPEGTRLATCGPKTVSIWDVETARILHSYPNTPGKRAIAVAFNKDSNKLTVCCVDASLRRRGPEDKEWVVIERQFGNDPFYGGGRGMPIATAFNPDGTQIAVAFRGLPLTVWSVESGNVIGRCRRVGEADKTQASHFSYPQRLTWNPVTEHVVGRYNDGCAFKWYPIEHNPQELDAKVTVADVACSPDGRFFVAVDDSGTLQVWDFENLSLLYQLSCTTPVTGGMAISRDGRRIYDLRETFCNVWEPNALLRLAEASERATEISSLHGSSTATSIVSEASAAINPAITCLTAESKSRAYASCDEKGTLYYIPPNSNSAVEVSCGFLGVRCVAISNDGFQVATAGIDTRIAIWDGATPLGGLLKLMETKSENVVQQVLFDASNCYLIVRCTKLTRVWSIQEQRCVASIPVSNHSIQWVNHPLSGSHIIAVSGKQITVHLTSSLQVTGRYSLDLSSSGTSDYDIAPTMSRRTSGSQPMSPGEMETTIEKVLVTPDCSRLLLQWSESGSYGRRSIQFAFVSTTSLLTDGAVAETSATVYAEALPAVVLSQIEIPLGFTIDVAVTGRRLLKNIKGREVGSCSLTFIDRDFWLQTWSLDDLEGRQCKKHFFLPRDWVNMDCLELALVSQDGRFLCPRNGEVAVVENGLRQEWVG